MHKIGVGFLVGAGSPRNPHDAEVIETCEDRDYRCCETLTAEQHEARYGYKSAGDDECEFEQRQPHEWYCTVHDVTKIAGTTEPIRCDWQELERDDDDGLEMHDDSCGECGHPYKRGDETHYPECSRIQIR